MNECEIKPCYVVLEPPTDVSFELIGYVIRVDDIIEDNAIYLDYEIAYQYAQEKGYQIT